MQKIHYFFLIIFFAVCSTLSAQETFTMKGTVSDDVETLVGVTVSVEGKLGGVITGIDGDFTIKAQKGDWLQFTYIGYEMVRILVTEEVQDLKVKMKVETTEIEEIVITVAGAQRKISTLASISTVGVDQLQTPSPSIANTLAGKVPGIISLQSSGEPGKNIAEFWVRGRSTFGANDQALVLIDGLEGNINMIDPADIETFSVLKDASATAVYGSRGSNGVILVTTKRGQSGKLSIMARANVTLSHINRLPEYLRAYDYALLRNEAFESRNQDPVYSAVDLQVIRDGLDKDLFPDVSWQDEIINRTSWKQSYYVSGQGGGDVARYFVSLNTSDENGAYKIHNDKYGANAGYNTYGIRLNLDINLTKSTVLYFGSSTTMSVNKRPGSSGFNTDRIWVAQAQYTPLLFPLVYSNGELPAATTSGNPSPYVMLNHYGQTVEEKSESKFTMRLQQKLDMITEGLEFTAQGAYDRNTNFYEYRGTIPPQYRAIGRNTKGVLLTRLMQNGTTGSSYDASQNQYRKYYLESKLFYNKVFGDDHRVGALLRYEMEDSKSAGQFSSWSDVGRSLSAIPFRYLGVSGQVEYSYRDTYLVASNFNYNGSENLMPGEQFGFFPSVSLGWIPSSYDWVKDNINWIDLFKIRASYGIVGNSDFKTSRFPYLDRITSGSVSPWGSLGSVESIGINRVGANNLRWEEAQKMNLGFDVQLFKNKVEFTVDIYKDKRDGIFQTRVQIPDYVGLTNNPFGNVGEMVNWGSDGNITFNHQINKDMSFTLRANYTLANNKIANWEQIYNLYPYQDLTGVPNGLKRGYQAIGLFKDADDIKYSPKQNFGEVKPGDIKYKDINGDGVVNSNDRVPLGYDHLPNLVYGFGGQFNYKDLTLQFLFKGHGQTDYFQNSVGYIPFMEGELGNVLSKFKDPSTRWIPRSYAEANGIDLSLAENPNAILPRLSQEAHSNNSQLSDFWKADAKYIRLQELSLSYKMRHDFLRTIGVKSMDVQLMGTNLYIWDDVKDYDPEQAWQNGAVYPIPAQYSLQLYLNF